MAGLSVFFLYNLTARAQDIGILSISNPSKEVIALKHFSLPHGLVPLLALALVVSEENGKISLAENGVLKRDLSIDELRSELKNGLIMQKKAEPRRLNFRLIRKDAAQLRKEADAPDENA